MYRTVLAAMTPIIGIFAMCLSGQESVRTQESLPPSQPVPVYRVTVVEHGIDAISYQYGVPPTKVDFRGTVLLPDGKGEATVQPRQGSTEVSAKFEKLPAPTRFGREYLTYVLWSISPDGGSYNIGEVIPDASDRAALHVTTDLPTFGMIVTAEPYAAVRQPSNVVVLENHARPDTAGKVQQIVPKAELMPRGQYTFQVEQNAAAPNAPKVSMSRYEALLHLYQAQNAVNVAQAAKAERYAPDVFAAAQRSLTEAQRLSATKGNDKLIIQNARDAAQHAEDARLIAERRQQEEQSAAGERSRAERVAPGSSDAGTPAGSTPLNQANREVRGPETHAQWLARIDGSLAAQDTPQGVVITLPDSDFDGINLLTSVSDKLAPIGTMVASHPSTRVNVQAYTGAGSSELQSWERAQAVRNRLVASGVAANQVAIERPGAQADRRVEIVISDGQ